MKILLIDNYDSFTYNLVHYVEDILGEKPEVYRNDEITLDEVKGYDAIILSPGPGIPDEAGVLKDVIRNYESKTPILGVCLGLQAIVEVFGGKLENLSEVYHGVSSTMKVTDEQTILFKDIPQNFEAGRYHSWVASAQNFPNELNITALDEDDRIMAIRHKEKPIYAVQFHPESILTPDGKQIIKNFIESIKN